VTVRVIAGDTAIEELHVAGQSLRDYLRNAPAWAFQQASAGRSFLHAIPLVDPGPNDRHRFLETSVCSVGIFFRLAVTAAPKTCRFSGDRLSLAQEKDKKECAASE
jgi:hypothetical protein